MARSDVTAEWRTLCDEEHRLQMNYATTMRIIANSDAPEARTALGFWQAHQERMRTYLRRHAALEPTAPPPGL